MKSWRVWVAVSVVGCSDSLSPSMPEPPLHVADAGSVEAGTALFPGEVCSKTNSTPLSLTFDPTTIVVAPGRSRPVSISVQPDLCSPLTMSIRVADPKVASAPSQGPVDLRHPTFSFDLMANALGTTTLKATLQRAIDPAPTTVELPITVQSGNPATCKAGDQMSGTLRASAPLLQGTGSLALASISTDAAAFTRTDEFGLSPFPTQIACTGDDLTQTTHGHPAAPGKLVEIGPAVTFTAGSPVVTSESLRRELDFTIPVNPASIPPGGRLRHLEVLFMSASYPGGTAPGTPGEGKGIVRTPRIITIASPRIYATGNGYALHFSSPWFGTYQAVFPADAGTSWRTRHLTHRAVVGISMGSGGAATFGMRHHGQFDVIGPMGGPSDWTWLIWFIKNYALGGFCPVTDPAYPNCPTYAPNLYPFHETYAHTVDFNHWFYQTGGGNGGSFGRSEYTQIFDDLALMLGNPNGQNADVNLAFFPAGPTASDLWVKGQASGLPSGVDCRVTVDPISTDPQYADEQMWQTQCDNSRCSNPWSAPTGYYDRMYNPDGSKPVISFCDGNQNGVTPYVDTYAGPGTPSGTNSAAVAAYLAGNTQPNDLALAVDLNGNGVRDANEPVLQQGNEPWSDTGKDGLFDVDEPGYDPVTNPDPNQDDYDFQLNPSGTENNHRYDPGEPYLDYGLDGVQGTKQQSQGGYDYGEGDGKFTMSQGLANFYAVDPHSILAQSATALPSGPMTDSELLRFDIWSDGGVRDLFNFESVANHLEGAIAARLQSDGTPLRQTAFYNGFDKLPGEVWGDESQFSAYNIVWPDLVDDPSIRYGTLDATAAMVAEGDGQHVGTAAQLLDRITASLFYTAQRWPDADRTVTELTGENPEKSTKNPAGLECELEGLCTVNFTGPVTGRTGPVIIQLPPGYALEQNVQRDVRYPVVYVLHGYGMQPSGLEAVAILSTNFMDDASKSAATRLAKFILVYVDGRCRIGRSGWPECIEGTFWLNSDRPQGAQMDAWFDEVVDYIDQNYRTMGPSDVSVLE
jgi:hypothetical protein